MKVIRHSIQQAADIIGRLLGRAAAVLIGFAMFALGLGMTATIVMLPVGILTMMLGVLILVSGLFARDDRTDQLGNR